MLQANQTKGDGFLGFLQWVFQNLFAKPSKQFKDIGQGEQVDADEDDETDGQI